MRRTYTFISIALVALGASSCKKCTECTLTSVVITDQADNKYYLWADGQVHDLPEGFKSTATATFGVTCGSDLDGCIDGVYRDYCGDDRDKVLQQPYVVSGITSTGSTYTAEYTYECR